MALQDFKTMNNFFRQLLMKRVEQAIAPKPTEAPQLKPSTAVQDLGARPQMTKPKMDLEFKGTTNPWSAALVALGNMNQMKNNLGRENELATQGDYSAKLKSGIDMTEDRGKKQNQLDFDVVDPNKIAERDYKEGVTTQNAWENFLKSETAPLEMQKLQAQVNNIGKSSSRQASDAARVGKVQEIYAGLQEDWMLHNVDPETQGVNTLNPEKIPTAVLNDLYQKAVLLSGDPKYALRAKSPKSNEPTPYQQSTMKVREMKQEESARVKKLADLIQEATPGYKPALNPQDKTKMFTKPNGVKVSITDVADDMFRTMKESGDPAYKDVTFSDVVNAVHLRYK